MKGHWEFLDSDGKWCVCPLSSALTTVEKIQKHMEFSNLQGHRFVEEKEEHKCIFNKCECGEVKSE